MNPGRFLTKSWLRATASTALLIGRKRHALEVYEQILALDPRDLEARATVGHMRMERGEVAAAIDAFLKLLEVAPGNAEAWFNLGFIYEQRDEQDAAERCFRRALELGPSLDRAWYGLALVLIRTGRLTEAVDALKRNIGLQPFSPYGYYQLAMTYHHLGEAGEAWRIYEQLKSFEPRYAATLKRDLDQTRSLAKAGASPATSNSLREALTVTRP